MYSIDLCAQSVLKIKKLVDEGKQHRYQAIRKASALLHEFYRYGSIAPSRLSHFDLVLLNPIFEELVEEYGNDALFSEKLSAVTVIFVIIYSTRVKIAIYQMCFCVPHTR